MPKSDPPTKLTLQFGALCPPLAEQLAGHRVSVPAVRLAQADADAVTRLLVRGLIPPKVADRARQRITDNLCEMVRNVADAETRLKNRRVRSKGAQSDG